jgi:hypothetical protein
MAKEKARKPRKKSYAGDKEFGERFGRRMERLGKKFGGRMGKQGRDFGEEIGELGERFGEHMGQRAKKREREWEGWRFGTFGPLWPIIGGILTLIFLAFGIWILDFINLSVKSYFVFQVSSFLRSNLYLFFAFSLFFGYARYLRRRNRRAYWILSPVVSSLGVVFFIWISIFMLGLINFYVGSTFIDLIVNFLRVNFLGIFIFFLVLGYAFELIKKMLSV